MSPFSNGITEINVEYEIKIFCRRSVELNQSCIMKIDCIQQPLPDVIKKFIKAI